LRYSLLSNFISTVYHRCHDWVKSGCPNWDELRSCHPIKTTRELQLADVFDFSFAKKANEDIKASGWKS